MRRIGQFVRAMCEALGRHIADLEESTREDQQRIAEDNARGT